MPVNEFEFELNGDKVYTGNIVPEVYPLSFQPYPDDQLRSIEDLAEILKDKERVVARKRWGVECLINQGRRSSCNAYMAAAMMMRAIYRATGKWIPVCPEQLYMRINGGRDSGSQLDDGMVEATDRGIAAKIIDGEELIPYQSYRKSDISMEHWRVAEDNALDQRFGECFQFDKSSVEKCWHSIVNCIVGNGVAGLAVHVGNSYMRSGEMAGFDNGHGNHAVCGDDVYLLTPNPKSIEDFVVDSPQSWGTRFADNGRTKLTYRHIEQTMRYHGLYGVRSVQMSRDAISETRIR